MDKKRFFLTLIISAFALSGCLSIQQQEAEPTNVEPSSTVEKINSNSETKKMEIDTTKTYMATMSTNYGDIKIKLYTQDAPVTVNNFVSLSNKNFYDGISFHRIVNNFMIQGGDPEGNGTGGPGYEFEDEIHANNKNNKGTIAMANAGPDTNGSQFFINLVNNNFLDPKHTVFGEVIEGMDVVEKIGNVEVEMNPMSGEMSEPVEPVLIKDIVIESL